MRLYPESAVSQLEFDKVKFLLSEHGKTEYAKHKAANLRIHTRKEYIDLELQQTYEHKLLLEQNQYFPNDFTLNISRDLKLLGIPGAMLTGEQWLPVRKLSENIQQIFRWFDTERRTAFPAMAKVIEGTYYEKQIIAIIDEILDENGNVKRQCIRRLTKDQDEPVP